MVVVLFLMLVSNGLGGSQLVYLKKEGDKGRDICPYNEYRTSYSSVDDQGQSPEGSA